MIPVDFTRGQEVYPQIAEELKELDIGVLGEFFSNIFILLYKRSVQKKCTRRGAI